MYLSYKNISTIINYKLYVLHLHVLGFSEHEICILVHNRIDYLSMKTMFSSHLTILILALFSSTYIVCIFSKSHADPKVYNKLGNKVKECNTHLVRCDNFSLNYLFDISYT